MQATFIASAKDPSIGAPIAIAIGVHNIPEGNMRLHMCTLLVEWGRGHTVGQQGAWSKGVCDEGMGNVALRRSVLQVSLRARVIPDISSLC